MFQEDNAPCHVSRLSNNWKRENDICILNWPPQSPDLSIIETVWRYLKTQIEKRLNGINTKNDLIRVVDEIWSSIPVEFIQELYHSLPKRISAVRKAKF